MHTSSLAHGKHGASARIEMNEDKFGHHDAVSHMGERYQITSPESTMEWPRKPQTGQGECARGRAELL